MREIILDTETTGLNAADDRITEIGCLELLDRVPSGRTYQTYLNPQRQLTEKAAQITGFTDAFLRDQPLFADIAAAFLAFIGDAPLVIHNAEFDMGFLNAELSRAGYPPLAADKVVDTLAIARQKFPGAPASLDALCRRFNIDNSGRVHHGALLDSELLAEVYLELRGGRQAGLVFQADAPAAMADKVEKIAPVTRARPQKLAARVSPAEAAAHRAFIADLPQPHFWPHKP